EQHPVGEVAVPAGRGEDPAEDRHRGLEHRTDRDRGERGEQEHADDRPVVADLDEHLQRCQQRRPGRPHTSAAQMTGEGGADEEERQRQVEDDVDEDAPGRAEPEQQGGTDDGSEQDAEAAKGGIEPHGAGQFATVDEVVEHHLLRRAPQASGEPVDDEEHARLPQLQGIGEEQYAPAQGHDHEHDLHDLDEPAAVEPLRQGTRIDGQEQERQPVADELESDERRGLERLPQNPVGDDVLDVVTHHPHAGADQVRCGLPAAQHTEATRGCRSVVDTGGNLAHPPILTPSPRRGTHARTPPSSSSTTATQRGGLRGTAAGIPQAKSRCCEVEHFGPFHAPVSLQWTTSRGLDGAGRHRDAPATESIMTGSPPTDPLTSDTSAQRTADMAKTTIWIGIILILIGVIGWIVTGFASWTALIPAILGIVLVICGWIGIKRPTIGVHIALVVALLGVIGTFSRALPLGDLFAGPAEVPLAVISSTLTFVLLIAYIVAGVRSFIAARRTPKDAEAAGDRAARIGGSSPGALRAVTWHPGELGEATLEMQLTGTADHHS